MKVWCDSSGYLKKSDETNPSIKDKRDLETIRYGQIYWLNDDLYCECSALRSGEELIYDHQKRISNVLNTCGA